MSFLQVIGYIKIESLNVFLTQTPIGDDAFWKWREFEGYTVSRRGDFRSVNLFQYYHVTRVF